MKSEHENGKITSLTEAAGLSDLSSLQASAKLSDLYRQTRICTLPIAPPSTHRQTHAHSRALLVVYACWGCQNLTLIVEHVRKLEKKLLKEHAKENLTSFKAKLV